MDTQTTFMTHHNSTSIFMDTDEMASPVKQQTSNYDAKIAQASDNAIEVSNTYTATSYSDCGCEMDSEYSEYLSETNQFLAF